MLPEEIIEFLMDFKKRLKLEYPDLYDKFNNATSYKDLTDVAQEYVNRMVYKYGG